MCAGTPVQYEQTVREDLPGPAVRDFWHSSSCSVRCGSRFFMSSLP